MKKKVLSFIMACCMILGCMGTATAATTEDVRTPVVLEQGISTRAVSAPTAYAPASWYGYDVAHYWTATYYTYSSYWFTTTHEFGLNIDVWAQVPFHVVFKTSDGREGIKYAVYNSTFGQYRVDTIMAPNTPFYMVIYNDTSTTIASGAGYSVYVPLDRD